MYKLFEYMYINWNFDNLKVMIGVLGYICMLMFLEIYFFSWICVNLVFVVYVYNNCIFRIFRVFDVLLC